jgi:hypothetical protein
LIGTRDDQGRFVLGGAYCFKWFYLCQMLFLMVLCKP